MTMPLPSVMISGASTGIGAACALCLEQRGFHVFAGVRKPADGEALRAKAPSGITWILLDVTQPEQIAAAAQTVAAAVGERGLQGLVNNAGIAVGGPLEFLPIAELRQQLEINVLGLAAVTQAFLPLIRTGRGRIVNMGSTSGFMSFPFMGAYAASKFAVEALTDALRVEMRSAGIYVALIEPGAIATPIWDKSRAHAESAAEAIPESGRAYYEVPLQKIRAQVEEAVRTATPPEVVAAAVAHALTARRPKTRYLVGKSARLQAVLARWLPDRMRDAIIGRMLGFRAAR